MPVDGTLVERGMTPVGTTVGLTVVAPPSGRTGDGAGCGRTGDTAALCAGRGRECLDGFVVAESAQVVAQRGRTRIPGLGVLGEQLGHDRLERAGHVGDDLDERLRCVVDLLVGDAHRVLAGERRLAGHHLVHHDAERVEVAARVGLGALGLLGREVGGGSHDRADLGEVRLRSAR